jgi:hypothetical protein
VVDFSGEVERYFGRADGEQFPRLQAWEIIYDYVNDPRFQTWAELASEQNVEKTALHLGFFLSNWGMFRGSSGLMRSNLRFFRKMVEILFTQIPADLWNLHLDEFTEDACEHVKLLDCSLEKLRGHLEKITTPTDTLVTKILMGIWGECPARDLYFEAGFRSVYPEMRVPRFSGEYMVGLNQLRVNENWSLPIKKTAGGNRYPAAKLIDMAFFEIGFRAKSGQKL